jgi:hypothetical protein
MSKFKSLTGSIGAVDREPSGVRTSALSSFILVISEVSSMDLPGAAVVAKMTSLVNGVDAIVLARARDVSLLSTKSRVRVIVKAAQMSRPPFVMKFVPLLAVRLEILPLLVAWNQPEQLTTGRLESEFFIKISSGYQLINVRDRRAESLVVART